MSLDCSALGNRLCDQTQPGGYCTIPGCERGTCPDDAVCVLFEPLQPRLSRSYCMAKCDGQGDCRRDDGYRCLGSDTFGRAGMTEARVLDGAGERFCAQPALQFDDGQALEGTGGEQLGDAAIPEP